MSKVIITGFFVFSFLFLGAQFSSVEAATRIYSFTTDVSGGVTGVGSVVRWTARVANDDDFDQTTTVKFSPAGGGIGHLETCCGTSDTNTVTVPAGAIINVDWVTSVTGTCPTPGVNKIEATVFETNTGTSGRKWEGPFPVYGAIQVRMQNSTSTTVKVKARVPGSVLEGEDSWSQNPGTGGPEGRFLVNCDNGPFRIEYSINGGPWRSDNLSEQNFWVTNGCDKTVIITYGGTFTTESPPPPILGTPTGISASPSCLSGSIQVRFSWNSASGARSYQVGVEDNNNPGTWLGGAIVTGTSDTWYDWPPNMNQRWFVRAFSNADGSGTQRDSSTASFNTGPCGGVGGYAYPYPTPYGYPTPGGYGYPYPTPSGNCTIQFQWAPPLPIWGSPDDYYVRQTGGPTTSPIDDRTFNDTYGIPSPLGGHSAGSYSFNVTHLQSGNNAGFGVTAVCPYAYPYPTPYSYPYPTPYSYPYPTPYTYPYPTPCTHTAPSVPGLTSPQSPANGSTIDPTTVILDWNAVTSWGRNCDGNNNRYVVYLSTDSANVKATSIASYTQSSGTTQHSVEALAPNTYYWLITATNGAKSTDSATWSFTIQHGDPPVTSPTNLQAVGRCVGSTAVIDFTWNPGSGVDGYFLQISGSGWPSTTYGTRTINGDTTSSFSWDSSTPTTGDTDPSQAGTQTLPQNGKTYYWRMSSFRNPPGFINTLYVYPPSELEAPGTPFTAPKCAIDLDLKDIGSEIQFYTDNSYSLVKSPTFQPSEPMFVQVVVKNTGQTDITSPFQMAFYLERTSDPGCDATPTSATTTISSLAAGTSTAGSPWRFTINAPATIGSKVAYVHADYTPCPNGAIAESNDSSTVPTNNVKSKAYSVDVDSWFETRGGDVGSHGQIFASLAPPIAPLVATDKYNSSFLIAGASIDSKVKTQRYKLNNYTKKLVPSGGTYNFLSERFRSKATGNNTCSIPNGGPGGDHWYQCTGDATFDQSNGPNGNNVFFIDGNFTIRTDLTLGPNETSTFIVMGDINIDPTVSRIDGIYVAGGAFESGSVTGEQLVVNGAVYADRVDFVRRLAASGCGLSPATECDNTKNPAELIIYDAKYLIGLNSLLGSPSFAWREVAP